MNHFIVLLLASLGISCTSSGNTALTKSTEASSSQDSIYSHVVDPSLGTLSMVWKDNSGRLIGSFSNLATQVQDAGKTLSFAMNGGMFHAGHSPVGLFVESGNERVSLDTTSGSRGNFYLLPNGVFYLTEQGKAGICKTDLFLSNQDIEFATQSGPMLLIDGEIHPSLTRGSSNRLIRNGVGILPNGEVIFAISSTQINFYDFATFFLDLGCQQALYLDGVVSRMYLPSQGIKQLDGTFAVIIAEIIKH